MRINNIISNIIILGVIFIAWSNRAYLKDAVKDSSFVLFYMENFRDKANVDTNHLVTTLDNGMPIVVNKHDRCVCWFVRLLGYWDRRETSVIGKIIKPGYRVVEVGANFGVHTLRMATLVGEKGHIDAFEANPQVSKYLNMSIGMNQLNDVITVHPNAAGDSNKDVFLSFGINNIGGGHVVKNASSNSLPTHMVRLDDVISGHVDVLKIDAEGSEGQIIKGAQRLLEQNPNIVIMTEWAPDHLKRQGSKPEEIIRYLENQGFYIWKINHNKIGGNDLIPLKYNELCLLEQSDIVCSRQNIVLPT